MNEQGHHQDLAHIRGLMERSTRFLSLSGLSGVFAGAVALVGALLARERYEALILADPSGPSSTMGDPMRYQGGAMVLFTDLLDLVLLAALVLVVALSGAAWFTWRRAKRTGQGLWDPSAIRLAWNLALPLVSGGVFCLAMLWHGAVALVAPATLVFYGLALLNASKYTLDEIRWLGLSEVVLGLLATCWPDAGLMFWALGFGVLHILYGGVMWFRHEASSTERA
jgi:pimeloyl-ACP methyl ester carboxylesterase